MKDFNLRNKAKEIGTISFVYDRAFQSEKDRFARYVSTTKTVSIWSHEKPENVINFIKKMYKNARNIKINLK